MMKAKDIEAAMRANGLTLETDGGGADAWHAVIGDTWHTRIVAEAYGSTRTQAKAKALAKYHALITKGETSPC